MADDVVAEDLDAAAVGPHEAGHLPDEGGLAGAVRAEQSEDLAARDVERHVVGGPHLGRRRHPTPSAHRRIGLGQPAHRAHDVTTVPMCLCRARTHEGRAYGVAPVPRPRVTLPPRRDQGDAPDTGDGSTPSSAGRPPERDGTVKSGSLADARYPVPRGPPVPRPAAPAPAAAVRRDVPGSLRRRVAPATEAPPVRQPGIRRSRSVFTPAYPGLILDETTGRSCHD